MTSEAPGGAGGRDRVVIGSRRSPLARAQAESVGQRLESAWPGLDVVYESIITEGDRRLDAALPQIGGKGVFTREIERALLSGDIDLAVHSLKDLPTEAPDGLVVAAIPPREDARDVLIVSAGEPSLAALPPAARLGTSSPRRARHALGERSDLEVVPIRGNVETRLAKVARGEVEATVLAAAGLRRLGLEPEGSAPLEIEGWLPAPGQGALAVQAASARPDVLDLARGIEDPPTRAAVSAERAFLAGLGAGCHTPVAAWATVEESLLTLRVIRYDPEGLAEPLRATTEGPAGEAETIGRSLAALLLGPQTGASP